MHVYYHNKLYHHIGTSCPVHLSIVRKMMVRALNFFLLSVSASDNDLLWHPLWWMHCTPSFIIIIIIIFAQQLLC